MTRRGLPPICPQYSPQKRQSPKAALSTVKSLRQFAPTAGYFGSPEGISAFVGFAAKTLPRSPPVPNESGLKNLSFISPNFFSSASSRKESAAQSGRFSHEMKSARFFAAEGCKDLSESKIMSRLSGIKSFTVIYLYF